MKRACGARRPAQTAPNRGKASARAGGQPGGRSPGHVPHLDRGRAVPRQDAVGHSPGMALAQARALRITGCQVNCGPEGSRPAASRPATGAQAGLLASGASTDQPSGTPGHNPQIDDPYRVNGWTPSSGPGRPLLHRAARPKRQTENCAGAAPATDRRSGADGRFAPNIARDPVSRAISGRKRPSRGFWCCSVRRRCAISEAFSLCASARVAEPAAYHGGPAGHRISLHDVR